MASNPACERFIPLPSSDSSTTGATVAPPEAGMARSTRMRSAP